jgi:hypothetical protein
MPTGERPIPRRLDLTDDDMRELFQRIAPLYSLRPFDAVEAYLDLVERGLVEIQTFLDRQPDRG